MPKTFPTPVEGRIAVPNPSSQTGEASFSAKCNACHPGGKAGVGPSLLGIEARMKEKDFFELIRAGRGTMMASPPGLISDEELRELWGFLKTLK